MRKTLKKASTTNKYKLTAKDNRGYRLKWKEIQKLFN